jgi:xanthine dehydrogenase YagS FAD-binding subunit
MKGPAFSYERAGDIGDALRRGAEPGAQYIAGGTDMLQLWKVGRTAPRRVVDVSRLGLDSISVEHGELRIGALARLHDVAVHGVVADLYPLLAEAISASASGQIRHMATVGGNLLQRTRCPYFRTTGMACNKAVPGSGCGALTGDSRHSALFGASTSCVATHPSDMAVALAALDADVGVTAAGATGTEWVPLTALYRLPADTPERDTTLPAGAIITQVRIRDGGRLAAHSAYVKVRDRASFEFALVSAAAALRVEGGVIAEVRLAAGGVAPGPWRLHEAESRLVGRAPDAAAFQEAAAAAVEGAEPLAGNGFKVELLKRAVVRALRTAADAPTARESSARGTES